MNRRDVLAIGLLVLGLVLYLLPYSRLGVDFHHDGIMLKPALDVLSGQILFKESFMQYGALTCYLQVIALWVSPTLLSLKIATIMAYAVALVFFYASWRMILPRSLTIISCVLLVWFIPAFEKDIYDHLWIMLPWSSAYAMSFQAIALFALLKVIREEEPEKWGFVLGLAIASVFWCRQPVGIILLGCVGLIWVALMLAKWAPTGHFQRNALLRIILGFAAVNALMMGGIWLSGATADWWYQNYVWPQKWAMAINSRNFSFVSLYLHLGNAVWLLLLAMAAGLPTLLQKYQRGLSNRTKVAYYVGLGGVIIWQHDRVLEALSLRQGGWTALIPILILLHALVYLVRVFKAPSQFWTKEHYVVAALTVICLGSLLQYYPVTESWHIMWALGPCFGLVVYQFRPWVGWSPKVVTVVILVALLPALLVKVREINHAYEQPLVNLTQPAVLRGMQVSPELAQNISQIMETLGPILKLRPDLPSAMIGNNALFLCFVTNMENPTPYFVTWPGLADEKINQRRWNYIQSTRPLMILQQADWSAVGKFYRKENYVPILYLPEEALEIAVPKELADAIGVTVYGKSLTTENTPAK